MMEPTIIITSTVQLIKFFKEGEMARIMSTMGDSHLDAALNILKNLNGEKDERGAIQRILTHLESSYHIYKNYDPSSFWKWGGKEHMIVVRKQQKTAELIVLCHRWLENSPNIIEPYIYDFIPKYGHEAIAKNKDLLKFLVGNDKYESMYNLAYQEYLNDDDDSEPWECQQPPII